MLTQRLLAGVVRTLQRVIRLSGRGGGATLPGLLLERTIPGVLHRAAVPFERVALISGTNGKTTTTAMLAAALSTGRLPVATNASGSNLRRGLVTALLSADSRATDAVLEVDEAVLPAAIDELRPRLVVLLNLSRDQLDRHHEVNGLAERWRAALGRMPADGVVVANATDPRVAHAAEGAPRTLLVELEEAARGRDDALCPSCGRPRTGPRTQRHEPCEGCGWAPGQAAVELQRSGSMLRLRTSDGDRKADLAVATDGYAIDLGAAWLGAVALGTDPDRALAAVANVGSVQDRYAEYRWHDTWVRLLLAKNPAGWDEALEAGEPSHAAVVAVNGFGPDGRDTSWLWDVDMGRLRSRPLVVATGDRAEDVALRLHLAGVRCELRRPLAAALRLAGRRPVDLFADYTSFRAASRLVHG
jgi:UDP-N-acetylmuramyl tripeptide synthase